MLLRLTETSRPKIIQDWKELDFHVDNGLKTVPQCCLSFSISPSLKVTCMGRIRSQRRFHSFGVYFDKLEHTFGKYINSLVWHAGRIRTTSWNAKSECPLGMFSYSGECKECSGKGE